MQLDQNDVSEKDSIRECFVAFQQRLRQSVELFHSLKNENSQLRRRVGELEAKMKALSLAQSRSEGEVAKLLEERKLVREKVEKVLKALSLFQSRMLG